MLTLASRRALVLFLTSTIVILKGASAEPDIRESTTLPNEERPRLNNPSYRFNRKEKKTCAWIGEKKQRKKKLCKKYHVKKSCPETCGFDSNEKRSRCPKKLPENGSSCARFEEGLACDYNHKYTGTCDGYETDFGCNAMAWAKCEDERWLVFMALPETCPPSKIPPGSPLEDLPFGEACNPKDCPLLPPVDKSYCFNYDGKGICGYSHGIQSTEKYFCNRDDPKNRFWEQSAVQPKECPAVEPRKGSSCADYEGKGTCDYRYETFGCDEDSVACLPTRSYKCNRQKKWKPKTIHWPQCEPTSGLSVGENCEPGVVLPTLPPVLEECPTDKPERDSSCSEYMDGLACGYDFRWSECPGEAPKCSAFDYRYCNEGVWGVYWIDLLPCEDGSHRYGATCDPNVDPDDDIVSLPPVLEECPTDKPEQYSSCSEYMDGLKCEYGFRRSECPGEAPKCSAFDFYYCDEGVWEVYNFFPALCEDSSSPFGATCDPDDGGATLSPLLDECPIEEPEPKSSCSEYMNTLKCDYGFRWSECPGEVPKCSALHFSYCYQGVWDVYLMSPEPCEDGSDRFGATCDPNV